MRAAWAALAGAALALLAPAAASAGLSARADPSAEEWPTRMVTIHYRAHNGARRAAYVILPGWYGPGANPPIPLIISPHGRGLTGRRNAAIWGNLPAEGQFAVVNPDGHGRVLPRHSWGYAGQIADLARMPEILRRALPWLRIDSTRIYAFGGSMGGQETLLLVARNPRLLAGAAAFDSVADLSLQYRSFPALACRGACRRAWRVPLGTGLQELARAEVGGPPSTAPGAYAARSPLSQARRLAFSCVPLQLWWSVADRVVARQDEQSAKLAHEIRRLNPLAPLHTYAGFWIHTAEMHAGAHLPLALSNFALAAPPLESRRPRLYERPPPVTADACSRRG